MNTWSSACSSGWKAVEPLRGGALIEEVDHRRWALKFYSPPLLPVSLGFLSTGSGILSLDQLCFPCLEGLYSFLNCKPKQTLQTLRCFLLDICHGKKSNDTLCLFGPFGIQCIVAGTHSLPLGSCNTVKLRNWQTAPGLLLLPQPCFFSRMRVSLYRVTLSKPVVLSR